MRNEDYDFAYTPEFIDESLNPLSGLFLKLRHFIKDINRRLTNIEKELEEIRRENDSNN